MLRFDMRDSTEVFYCGKFRLLKCAFSLFFVIKIKNILLYDIFRQMVIVMLLIKVIS